MYEWNCVHPESGKPSIIKKDNMADRLVFTYKRTSRNTARGVVTIDVLDPGNQSEIEAKLKGKEFSSSLVTENEFNNDKWEFTPQIEVEVAND